MNAIFLAIGITYIAVGWAESQIFYVRSVTESETLPPQIPLFYSLGILYVMQGLFGH